MRGISLVLLCLASCGAAWAGAGPPWVRQTIDSGGRLLAASLSPESKGPVLTVVIEGDGRSHDPRGRPTRDPTPGRQPAGLAIAQAWPGPTAWLGRLCQYVRDAECAEPDWTTGRYSAEAVATTNAAIDQLKRKAGAERVRLVGWSGGGVIAVLAARARGDVTGVVTFASPLDLQAWTRRHGLSSLTGSLDPGSLAPVEDGPPQIHFIGALDGNVPPAVAREAASRLGRVAIRRERHDCCWAKRVGEAVEMLNLVEGLPGLQ